MILHLLPTRTGGAAENMALDFLLLRRYPRETAARFRHYAWRSPAFTFGYSQKIEFVRGALPAGETFDLCRRPSGGGLVDHRDDWTYALVIPRDHPLDEIPATQSYRTVHEALAGALRIQNIAAITKAVKEVERVDLNALSEPAPRGQGASPVAAAGICFQRAELYDVMHETTGEKIAGAAQKRNKHGLLFQGSIARSAVGATLDWEKFETDFSAQLAQALAATAAATPWPEFDEDEVSRLTEQYSSPEWLESR